MSADTPVSTNDSANSRGELVKARKAELAERHRTFLQYVRWLGVGLKETLCLVSIGARNGDYRNKEGGTAAIYGSWWDLAAALDLEETINAEGIYLLPNEVIPELSARELPVRWAPGAEQPKDTEISRRRVICIDCDPKRISKISSTQEQLELSQAMAEMLYARLAELLGSSASLALACSGNGFHVLIAVDIPTETDGRTMEDPGRQLAERLLGALAVLYDTPRVTIDRSVVDARRILPSYGTWKKKGRNTAENPHRQTTFEPAEKVPQRLGLEALSALVVAIEAGMTKEQLQLRGKIEKKAPVPAKSEPSKSGKGEDRLSLCAAIPLRDVMSRLGLDAEHPACPSCGHVAGRGDTSVRILDGDRGGVLKCLHGTCGGATYGSVSLVAKQIAGVESLKGDKESVRKVLGWFVSEGFIEPPKKRVKPALTPEELEALGYSFEALDRPENDVEVVVDLPKRNLSDLGNAERLVDRHGREIRYCVEWSSWLVWDGTRWVRDVGLVRIRSLAMETVRALYSEAAAEGDVSRRIALAKHAGESERRAALSAMISLAEALCPISTEELDQDHWALNCPNGTIDLRTGLLRPHNPKDWITKVTTVDYDPHADRSVVDVAFERSHPDPEVRAYLWRLWGYSCTGMTTEHTFPIHWGAGRNGKGLFLGSILKVLGSYGCMVPTELMVESRGEQHPAVRATLFGVRFALASETEEGARLKVAQIKTLCGGDAISARGMRENFFTFSPTHQLHLQTNPKPVITGPPEDPIWERIHLIPWGVVIPKAKRDKSLPARLAASKGLLRALVEGCVDYVRAGGLEPPPAVLEATETYRAESDVIGEFVDDSLEVTGDPTDYVTSADVYSTYQSWCESSGRNQRAKNRLMQDLDKAGVGTSDRIREGRIRRGIKLRGTKSRAQVSSGGDVTIAEDDATEFDQMMDELEAEAMAEALSRV